MPIASPTPEPIVLIVATRCDINEFYEKSATGRSFLQCYAENTGVRILVALNNTAGLPAVYNNAARQPNIPDDAILVFVHDDVHLVDFFWPERVREALKRFQIVGLAGNRRRLPGQISWAFADNAGTWDTPENLSGRVGHGDSFPCVIDRFGQVGVECKLLDGLFLAMRKQTLLQYDLTFDERFAFHFYDLDFCRQAELKEVSMGTVGLSVIHQSFGSYGNAGWLAGYRTYLKKWGS